MARIIQLVSLFFHLWSFPQHSLGIREFIKFLHQSELTRVELTINKDYKKCSSPSIRLIFGIKKIT